jgi:hypothetical protein
MLPHFLFGRCVNADAAAVFAAALDLGLLSTFAAADAALALVTSVLPLVAICFLQYLRVAVGRNADP